MKKLLLSCLLIATGFNLSAQKFTVSGYIKDAATGESLIGATIYHPKSQSGTTANTQGFYSITLPGDSVTLMYSFVGYATLVLHLQLQHDTTLTISLQNSTTLNEVVVTATKAEAIHESTTMGNIDIPIQQIKSLPAFMGEVDILKVIQLLPGVQSGEGSTGIYVRGGGPDQNLMLLDGVPVYNAMHLFGFFSVFNSDAINHVELTKGGFPARYGGRLSSVLDINMKDGNMKDVHGEGSASVVAAKFTIEAPLKKDKSSFILSGRRTYIDALAQPFIRRGGARGGYYFYDLNFKYNQIINNRDRVFVSLYSGNDKAHAKSHSDEKIDPPQTYDRTVSDDQGALQWGNIIGATRWNHVISPKLFSNVTASYSRYLFAVGGKEQTNQYLSGALVDHSRYSTLYKSGIQDWATRIDLDYVPNPNHFVKTGVHATWHKFTPGVLSYNSTDSGDTTAGATVTRAFETSGYLEDDWRVSSHIKINVGVHASAFNVDAHVYHSVQPRFAFRYLIREDLALKGSFASMAQYIHLLTNAGIGLPTDLWVSSTKKVAPQRGSQVALGLARTFQSQYEISLEGYYKEMHNLIDYKQGASYLNTTSDWQDKVATGGIGKSYGVEFFVQKKTGRTTGWVGYTLSKSTRQFKELNFGKVFPYKYDRRHDVSVTVSHKLKEHVDVSGIWVFGTGNAITLPTAAYSSSKDIYSNYFDGTFNPVTYYGERNSFRMHSYHRLDLSITWSKQKSWGIRKWSISLYNVYNRKNPFYVTTETGNNGKTHFVQYSLFPILPSISYAIKF